MNAPPPWGAAVLCLPILQLRLLCGALFSNAWAPCCSNRGARISLEVFKMSEMTLLCSVAFTFFCASHARWRCRFQLSEPLCGANANLRCGRILAEVFKMLEIAFPCSVALTFFVLPMLGGVAVFNVCNTSAARVLFFCMRAVKDCRRTCTAVMCPRDPL